MQLTSYENLTTDKILFNEAKGVQSQEFQT